MQADLTSVKITKLQNHQKYVDIRRLMEI